MNRPPSVSPAPSDGCFVSNSAVPSTTEHSRSTINCGRTVTLPNRPEAREPQNRKLEAVDRRRIEPSYKPLYGADVARKTERRRNMRPNAQLFRTRRAHDHQVLARALCKQRRCSNASSNTAPLPPLPLGLHSGLAVNKRRHSQKLAGQQKIVVPPHFPLDFPGTGSIAVHVDGLSWVAARLAPSAGLVVVQASRRAMRIQRMKTMASKQPRKQAKSAKKSDIGEANQPAHDRQRTPRRRTLKARSKSTATQTGEAAALAAAASRGTSKSIGRSKNTPPPPEDPASQSDRIAEGVNLAMAKMPDADRPRGSTKRAMLIGMLERPEGASVAEIGQRLGWLPHTVRAAFTGLRHAGREVTRSKDAEGQSVYRLARVETAPDR